MIWIELLIVMITIFIAGVKLTKYSDIIAEKTGLGRLWIGVILVATATSMPELTTGITSAAVIDAPDIAIGDALGSCIFNLLLIVLADFLFGNKTLLSRSNVGHIIAAGFGLFMVANVGISLFIQDSSYLSLMGAMGSTTVLLIAAYIIAIRSIFKFEKETVSEYKAAAAEAFSYDAYSLKYAVIGYVVSAFFVIVAAYNLPKLALIIADMFGIGDSFIGTVLVAFSTSLPEIVVVFAALRLNIPDMAIANIFGSNLFNLAIIGIDDIFYTKGAILQAASESHIITAFSIMMIYGLAIFGLIYRVKRRTRLNLGWESIAIVLIFVTNTLLLYEASLI